MQVSLRCLFFAQVEKIEKERKDLDRTYLCNVSGAISELAVALSEYNEFSPVNASDTYV